MMKMGLWVGAPALVTYLVASHTLALGHVLFLGLVGVMALAVGIVPRLPDRLRGHKRANPLNFLN